ncbi:hypothetical protein VLC5_50 [Klebsiella phage VLC5]|uniref:Uncharacterized protein n=1 Tax=Klebsiella phage VLC5 TaxID=2723742 RepID=A0A6H0X2P7_9CAUD|nr:hypothetical protein VLC5_50 [Klebsiella phage VLC5]
MSSSFNSFDDWYAEVCAILHQKGLAAPYRMAWLEFYERGISPEDAATIGPFTVE